MLQDKWVRTVDKFLDSLQLQYGPTELQTRFIIKACLVAAERGVYLELGTFGELLEVNKRNQDSWRPLTTTLRADPGGAHDDAGVIVFGRNGHGDVVATQAMRLFDWRDTNFKTEAEALRFFYAEPDRHRRPNETCEVTSEGAADITGKVLLGGGIWYREDYRRIQLAEIVPRLSRACAYGTYGANEMIGIVSGENVRKNLAKKLAMRMTEGQVIMRDSPGYPDKEIRLTLVRQTPDELMDDLFNFVMDFETEVDTRVYANRA